MPEVASYATGILLLIVIAAILLMWDTQRKPRCAECPHCKRLVEDEKRATALAVHKQYHAYTTNVAGCEFCDVRESGGVPPPTGSTKKE
jgi:hypothetical protein